MSPIPTVQDTLRATAARLQAAGVPEAGPKSEWLLAHLLGVNRSDLLLRAGDPFPGEAESRIEGAVRRLARHEPLQYVLGDEYFLGRPFLCDSRALIPRPETEILVDLVLASAPVRRRPRPRIADVGTGTGCLAISLALECPWARIIATDCDPRTLTLARRNARRFHVSARIRFLRTDLLAALTPRSLDAVVANPPYVSTGDWMRLERQIRRFEPRLALDGGPDGLDLIRRLAGQARGVLRPGGALLLEIGNDQETRARRILRDTGFVQIACHRDLQGHPRNLVARLRDG
jgi:release factor glutamine methyltransferase